MNVALAMPPWGRWFILFLLIASCLLAFVGVGAAAPADTPILTAASPSPLVADLFQDIVGNRTRLIQMSFLCILAGIFILWKK